MKMNCLNILVPALAVILISGMNTSCSKSHGKDVLSDSAILMSHPWYPYSARVVETDSGNVFSPGKDTVVTKDTSFYFEECMQQSTYTFYQNHVLEINNGCYPPAQQNNGPYQWNVTSTGGMQLPILLNPVFGIILGVGDLTAIDQSQFTFNSPGNTSGYGSEGVSIWTNKSVFVTFRKK